MTDNINRAFMYGESVFTTMRMVNGVVKDWELHFERLRKSVEFVYGPFKEADDWAIVLRNRLETKVQELSGDKILRPTLYLEQARGLLRSSFLSVTDLRIHVSHSPLELGKYEERMVKLRSCPGPHRPKWWPSYLKAGSYLETILALKIYLQEQDDDLLFLSNDNTILETSVANIFIVKNRTLLTPPAGPNVLEGVMRRKVMKLAENFFDDFSEAEVTLKQVREADAVFGTNSVKGLFLVDRIDDYEITYSSDFLSKFGLLKENALL